MKALIDTCIISPFLSKHGPSDTLIDWLVDLEFAAISIVTLFEIEMGLKCAGLVKTAKLFPSLLENYEIQVMEISREYAQVAAEQGSKMKKKGFSYSLQDLWIGATAAAEKLDLATANLKDFEHWDIKIFNPLRS